MAVAAGLAVLGLLCSFVGVMMPNRGAGPFFVAFYAFLILAAVRFVWLAVSRGRAPADLPISNRKAQWLVGGVLAFVIWWTLSTMMSVAGPWQPWGMVVALFREAIREAWAVLTGQPISAELFPF